MVRRRRHSRVVRFTANTVVVDDSDEEFILVGFADEPDGAYRDRVASLAGPRPLSWSFVCFRRCTWPSFHKPSSASPVDGPIDPTLSLPSHRTAAATSSPAWS